MTSPFHALGVLRPTLSASGYGTFSDPTKGSGAALDVLSDLGASPPARPVLWPGNGTTVPDLTYSGFESPDPLTSCPGYDGSTVGLPVLAQFGHDITVRNALFADASGPLPSCEIDAHNYTNPSPGSQSLGRSILSDAVVLVPRQPLVPGHTYTVSINPGSGPITWSFHTDAQGWWTVRPDGSVRAHGGAGYYGSLAGKPLAQPIVGMAATPSGKGYWLVARDGGVFSFGDAAFLGSTGAIRLNQPIVGMAASPTGKGYWFVAADGGIFNYGDAAFHGSTGAIHLNQPIVGMAATPSGRGYWLVARDGGIFNFGDAAFHGSTGAIHLARPIVGMAASPSGNGYWFVAADGGVFNFGDATFFGSGLGPVPVVAMTVFALGGYRIIDGAGETISIGLASTPDPPAGWAVGAAEVPGQ
jgi:ribosomal protein L24E